MSHNKQIFKISTLKKLLNEENSCVSLVPSTRILALPPFFLNDMKSGILYLLNSLLKKYDRSLGGIIIGYQNIKVLMDENTGVIPIGTAETEVNVSVEFYIFQPKIGSLLRGVINKISNSHIGCLIHRYFNATILKPDDVSYDDWISHDLQVDDEIILKVKDLDFTSLLPHIEGVIDESMRPKNNRISRTGGVTLCDLKEKNTSKESDFESERTSDLDTLKDNVNKILDLLDDNIISETPKKKKKKKKKEKDVVDSTEVVKQSEEALSIDDKESASDTISKKSNTDEKYYSKKKKKKDKKKEKESVNLIEDAVENDSPKSPSFLEVNVRNAPEDKEMTPVKSKKGNKSKTEEPELEVDKTNQCFSSNEAEDDVFYSTEIYPSLPKKMSILCSPISKSSPFEEKPTNSQSKVNDKEKKQKHKKRKREEEEEDSVTTPKKIKLESTKVNKSKNSLLQNMMEELKKKEIDRIKEELNMSDKEHKKKKKKEKSEQNTADEIRKQEIQKIRDELNISDRESSKSVKKSKKKKTNEESKEEPQVNGTVSDKKLSVQEMMDKLIKEQMKKIEEKPKKEKKAKRKENKTTTSLYDDLLKEAKSAIDSDGCKSVSLPIQEKKNDLTIEKSFNGDAYDTDFTCDKSRFSDSDQSQMSSVKAKVGVNKPDVDASTKEKESVKNGKKKSKKRSKSDDGSLYEKLLRDAKSLIFSGNETKKSKKIK